MGKLLFLVSLDIMKDWFGIPGAFHLFIEGLNGQRGQKNFKSFGNFGDKHSLNIIICFYEMK